VASRRRHEALWKSLENGEAGSQAVPDESTTEEASQVQDDDRDASWASAPAHRTLPTPTPWEASLPFSAVRILRVHLQF
jgi:hypothetical protein